MSDANRQRSMRWNAEPLWRRLGMRRPSRRNGWRTSTGIWRRERCRRKGERWMRERGRWMRRGSWPCLKRLDSGGRLKRRLKCSH
ncbi:uncharacterized protein PODANS_4_5750 [Podospora anserina S mat+]|uniref:Podospora anserina S mat+ genomic DNA chromosome 4, supercontig 4 n=1 Tax=Podospora anserina (strain S / ATCC MYA-4624 / DSM 980 / FGSC 10383) TaxID=515849 RepID=B2AQ01_PODAN|nr:uncharacterized protein PODANS_4_5750 [Podospora anserina S mat+]CAP66940.1 unnamed protein product [Podospora anserina S mat+]CDP28682.1 Putative protein of unknown function [Podospora anserina S mat+]